MSVRVPLFPPNTNAAATEIARPASGGRIAVPLADMSNHLLGHILNGLFHWQFSIVSPANSGIAEMYTHRHANCDFVYLMCGVSDNSQVGATLAGKAGSGATITHTMNTTTTATSIQVVPLLLPWGGDDYQKVTITPTNCSIRWLMLSSLPREALDEIGTTATDYFDSSLVLAGLRESEIITDSSEAGLVALRVAMEAAWDEHQRQAVSWWTTGTGLGFAIDT